MNNKITNYYTHTIPQGKKVKLSNNITNTLIVLSKDRNKFIYKNPYDFVLNLEQAYYDVIEIELVRLYFNYCKNIINNDNNSFEFFYSLNNDDYVFNMNLGEFNPTNNDAVKNIFNSNYKSTLEPYIKCWFDKNISQIINGDDNSISFNLPKLFLDYSSKLNRFFFYNLSKNNYKSPEDLLSFSNMDSNILNYNEICYIRYGLDIRGNKKYYATNLFSNKIIKGPDTNNPNLHNYTYNNNNENLFLSLLGFNTDVDFTENSHTTNNIDITIYSREYLETSLKVIGLRINYNNGNFDIVGNGNNNTYLDYNNKVNYDINNSGRDVPQVLSTAPVSNQFPTENLNGTPIDYAINIEIKPIFYQVLDIKISKNIDQFIYNQILYLLQSESENLGIKLEYFLNNNILGNIKLENFKEFNETDVRAEYDLSYFNNLLGSTKGIYKSTNIYKRLIGYLGYQKENNYIIIKWGRFYNSDVYGTNLPLNGILLQKVIPTNIFNSNIPNPIFTSPITRYASPNFTNTPGIYIFNNNPQEYSSQEPQFNIYNNYTKIVLTTNFFFGNNNPCLESPNYVLLDIEELNNKDSNNEAFNKSFIEIPINTQYLRYYDVTNLGYGTKYFNPPLKKIDRLTIKVKDINGNILKKPNHTNDFTFIFNIKQINNTSNIVIN